MTTPFDALIASDYVICATLRKVADVFNAELLWEQVRGRQDGVSLSNALQRYPRVSHGRQHQETYYRHVIVRISERDYVRDERLEDGFGRRVLLQELRRRHEQELGGDPSEHAVIRYRLEPDSILRVGEVQFLFGRAIYLPAEDEKPAFRIQAATEKESDWRDVAPIYPQQRLTLLNGDRRASTVAVVAWPFPGSESVLLMLRSDAPTLVDVVAEPPGGLTLISDSEGGFTARDRRGRGLRLRVVALTGSTAESAESIIEAESAILRTAPDTASTPLPVTNPVAPAKASKQAPEPSISAPDETCPLVDPWGRREPVLGWSADLDEPLASMPVVDPVLAVHPPVVASSLALEVPTPPPVLPQRPTSPTTAVLPDPDQRTWIPQRPAVMLQVLGIALQRLSAYAAAGISDWRIGFSREGGLMPSGHPDAIAWLRVDSADRLFGEVVGQATPLDLPGIWQPFPELDLRFYAVPSPMTTHYLGWVRLPEMLALPVPYGREVSFGRGAEADIAPRLLADPRSLRWDGNAAKTVGINAEYLGLSRRHLRVQARRDDWWVQLESENMPVYRLTASGDLLDVLNPGVNTATTAKPGELLVAGGYVLALGALDR